MTFIFNIVFAWYANGVFFWVFAVVIVVDFFNFCFLMLLISAISVM